MYQFPFCSETVTVDVVDICCSLVTANQQEDEQETVKPVF